MSASPAAEAGAWPNWRGPFGNGVAEQGQYPIGWSADADIAWQV